MKARFSSGGVCLRVCVASAWIVGSGNGIVDAADYFRLARQAMLKARSQILMIGWDFDTRIALTARRDLDVQLQPRIASRLHQRDVGGNHVCEPHLHGLMVRLPAEREQPPGQCRGRGGSGTRRGAP